MTIVYNEPCGEEITSSSGEGNNNNNITGSGNNPPDPPVPPPPEFLAPDNHISKVVLTADREINIIPRQYFLKVTDVKKYFISFANAEQSTALSARDARYEYFPVNAENPSLANTTQQIDN